MLSLTKNLQINIFGIPIHEALLLRKSELDCKIGNYILQIYDVAFAKKVDF